MPHPSPHPPPNPAGAGHCRLQGRGAADNPRCAQERARKVLRRRYFSQEEAAREAKGRQEAAGTQRGRRGHPARGIRQSAGAKQWQEEAVTGAPTRGWVGGVGWVLPCDSGWDVVCDVGTPPPHRGPAVSCHVRVRVRSWTRSPATCVLRTERVVPRATSGARIWST
eukprot:scaffold9913_cov141-Isochrysis_galbana.AAC.1